MDDDSRDRAKMAILEAVEDQLASNEPPKVRETLNRLMSQGIERDEALKYIACALSIEIFGVLKHSEPFDPKRYDSNLDNLPDMPWEDEE